MKQSIFPAALVLVLLSCSPKPAETAGGKSAAPASQKAAPSAAEATQEAEAGKTPVMIPKTTSSANPLEGTGLSLFPEPQDVPDISFVGLDGKTVSLSDYKGKVVLLNFWATWCPPCKAEMPSIQRLSQKLAGKDFTVLAISVKEDRATVESFLAKNPYTFPIFLDESGEVSGGFVGRGIPTTYVVGKDGRALGGIVGSKEWDEDAVVAALTSLAAK